MDSRLRGNDMGARMRAVGGGVFPFRGQIPPLGLASVGMTWRTAPRSG